MTVAGEDGSFVNPSPPLCIFSGTLPGVFFTEQRLSEMQASPRQRGFA
jgi:hypothetical protein